MTARLADIQTLRTHVIEHKIECSWSDASDIMDQNVSECNDLYLPGPTALF